jgi:hypothetical protein
MKINISNIQRMYSAVLLPIRAQISSEFWYCVLELVKYPDVPIMRLKMDWRQQRKWIQSKDNTFDVYWTDEMDTNRRQCMKKIADSIRNKQTVVRELEANFESGITSDNLDNIIVRRIYNSVYPRATKARNPRGAYENSVVGYRFFFFTYNGQDKPILDDVPSIFAYKIAQCVQKHEHFHGTIITTLHYKQTFIHSRIRVGNRKLLDVQAIYRSLHSVHGYISGQAPRTMIEYKKTNVYGNWDNNLEATVSICPQNEKDCLDKGNAIKIGDLPYYGQYEPSKETTAVTGRTRTRKRFHIEFKHGIEMDSYIDLLSSMIFTDKDIIELQNPFNFRQYSGEPIVVVRDHTDFQLSILISDFTEHHRCNNIALILTISSGLIIQSTDKIDYQNRFDFLDELRTPKEAFEDV